VAQEFLHAGVREHREQRFDRSSNLAAQRSSCTSIIETRGPCDVGHVDFEGRLHGQRREMTQLRHGAHLHEGPRTQDRDPVAQCLDLAQYVRREQHTLTALLGLKDALTKGLFHEWIQTARRFVEDEQFGARHERGDEDQLLTFPFESARPVWSCRG